MSTGFEDLGFGLRFIGMAEAFVRRSKIADDLLQLLDIRETAFFLAAPDKVSVDADIKGASRRRRQGHTAEFPFKGRQKLLSIPGGAQQPAALRAVPDRYHRLADFAAHQVTQAINKIKVLYFL